MKSTIKLSLLAIFVLSSTLSWSMSPNIDLGEISIPPGSHVFALDSTGMYENLAYQIECRINPLAEETAIIISQSYVPNLEIFVGETQYPQRKIIPLLPNTALEVKLNNVINSSAHYSVIHFTNLDQTQTLEMHCTANLAGL